MQVNGNDAQMAGSNPGGGARGGGHVGGTPGNLYGTSVGCFILAIPNRYLPILQEGKIAGFENRFGG